ncbi:hypothetical protein ACFSM7_07325 [Clavibacter michiganensis subsp. tessellarius]
MWNVGVPIVTRHSGPSSARTGARRGSRVRAGPASRPAEDSRPRPGEVR